MKPKLTNISKHVIHTSTQLGHLITPQPQNGPVSGHMTMSHTKLDRLREAYLFHNTKHTYKRTPEYSSNIKSMNTAGEVLQKAGKPTTFGK